MAFSQCVNNALAVRVRSVQWWMHYFFSLSQALRLLYLYFLTKVFPPFVFFGLMDLATSFFCIYRLCLIAGNTAATVTWADGNYVRPFCSPTPTQRAPSETKKRRCNTDATVQGGHPKTQRLALNPSYDHTQLWLIANCPGGCLARAICAHVQPIHHPDTSFALALAERLWIVELGGPEPI